MQTVAIEDFRKEKTDALLMERSQKCREWAENGEEMRPIFLRASGFYAKATNESEESSLRQKAVIICLLTQDYDNGNEVADLLRISALRCRNAATYCQLMGWHEERTILLDTASLYENAISEKSEEVRLDKFWLGREKVQLVINQVVKK